MCKVFFRYSNLQSKEHFEFYGKRKILLLMNKTSRNQVEVAFQKKIYGI